MSNKDETYLVTAMLNGFKLYKRRWLILAIFSLVSMTNEIIWISFSSINSIVKEYYGVSAIAVEWLSMIYFVLFAFVIATSYIMDRYGLKFTITTGATLNLIGSAIRCFGVGRSGFGLVFTGTVFAAIAQCFLLNVPPRLAAVWFGEHERATASAIGVLTNMSGIAIGFLMGTIVPNFSDKELSVRNGISTLLITQAVVCFVLMVLSIRFIDEAPPSPASRSQAAVLCLENRSTMAILKHKARWYRTCMGNIKNFGALSAEQIYLEHENEVEISNSQEAVENVLRYVKKPRFRESLMILAKDKSFHVICQAFSIYFGLNSAYNTILNQMIISKHPGKEKEIGYLGCAANLFGVSAMFLSGIWLDKTKRYKTLSISINLACALTLLIFTFLLTYNDNFTVLFLSFCIFGLFSYPYMSAGLEHAAEITYPIPEGTTSGILLLTGSIYGMILTFVIQAAIEKGAPEIGGYLMVGLYCIGTILVSIINVPLKRFEADQERRFGYRRV